MTSCLLLTAPLLLSFAHIHDAMNIRNLVAKALNERCGNNSFTPSTNWTSFDSELIPSESISRYIRLYVDHLFVAFDEIKKLNKQNFSFFAMQRWMLCDFLHLHWKAVCDTIFGAIASKHPSSHCNNGAHCRQILWWWRMLKQRVCRERRSAFNGAEQIGN